MGEFLKKEEAGETDDEFEFIVCILIYIYDEWLLSLLLTVELL